MVNLFFTFISFLLGGVAKREGAEAGGLRAGGSRNAVYGDRVRQKENEPKHPKEYPDSYGSYPRLRLK